MRITGRANVVEAVCDLCLETWVNAMLTVSIAQIFIGLKDCRAPWRSQRVLGLQPLDSADTGGRSVVGAQP